MKEKRKYDHQEIDTKVKNMFLRLGFPVPEEAKPRRIVVHGEHGEIIEDHIIGKKPEEKDNV